jgi:hypothetical protein
MWTKFFIFHISIRINGKRIDECLLYGDVEVYAYLIEWGTLWRDWATFKN